MQQALNWPRNPFRDIAFGICMLVLLPARSYASYIETPESKCVDHCEYLEPSRPNDDESGTYTPPIPQVIDGPSPQELEDKKHQDAINLNDQGLAQCKRGSHSAAIGAFRAALDLWPENETIRKNLASEEADEKQERISARIGGMLSDFAPLAAAESSARPSLEFPAIEAAYWAAVAPPAACVIQHKLTASDACSIIDDIDLIRELYASKSPRRFAKLVLNEAINRAVVFNFPESMSVEARVRLVQALYEAEFKAFATVYKTINAQLADDSEGRMRDAGVHSKDVDNWMRSIALEHQGNILKAERFLRSRPDSVGIRFDCSNACRRLVSAANAAGAW